MDLEFLPFLVFAVITALMVAGGLLSHLSDKRRHDALAGLADTLGLSFAAEDDSDLVDELAGVPLFSQGRSRQIRNRIQADTDEVSMSVFDYRYTTGSGKNSSTHQQTVACFDSPHWNLPQFEVKPQHLFHGIGKVFGYQDIDFASHAGFSRAFLLRGANEQAIRRLFTGSLLAFLEARPNVSVEGRGYHLIVYRSATRVQPEQLREFMAEAFAVFRQFRDAAREAASATGPEHDD
jgi:hypothetical protein